MTEAMTVLESKVRDAPGGSVQTVRDADGHLIEDIDAILAHVPAAYRERAFRHRTARGGIPPLDLFHGSPMEVRGGGEGDGSPDVWRAFMDEVGIRSTVLYPTNALAYGNITDAEWADVFCRAYNDWIHERYLGEETFSAMALIPMQHPAAAAVELGRAVNELGMPGAMLPSNGLAFPLGDRFYDPVYQAADNLGCALSVHGGAHGRFGMEHVNVYGVIHAIGHPLGQMISLGSMVGNGVFERWENIRVAYLEGGVAWLLLMLERLDRSCGTHVQLDTYNRLLPSEKLQRASRYTAELLATDRIFIGCEGEEPALAYAVREVGPAPFMYSSDFPHEVTVASCKEELEELAENPELDERARDGILHANAERFYKLG